MYGFAAILLKEFSHIRRDRSTLFFAFAVPALQLTIFGYAIDVTIDNIPMAVFDLDGHQDSRRLVEALCNTRTFRVVERVHDRRAFRHALTAGRARAGLLIPADYSEKLLRREQARVQVLVDGSDSTVATPALNAVNLLATQMSLRRGRAVIEAFQICPARDASGAAVLPMEARTRLLYKSDRES